MPRSTRCRAATLALVVCSFGLHASAAPGETAAAGDTRPAISGTIVGSAWDAADRPIAHALLHLRNVTTARVEGATRSSEAGRFTFEDVEGGSYVVELLNGDGRVIAVSPAFTVAAGDIVATFVRLGSRHRWFAGFFNSAGAAAVLTAASLGVTAVAPTGQASTPEH